VVSARWKEEFRIKTLKIRAFGLILSAFLAVPCLSVEDSTPKQAIGPFGTLNNTDDALVLPDNMAQDLLNVEITDGGKSVRKRKGLGLAYTLPISTSAVHGVYNFYDSAGNDVSLFFNDRHLTGSVNGAAITTIFSTGTVNATWTCTDSLGYAYCASTAREPIIKTNGVTYTQVLPMTSIGTMVTATTERLVTAGFSGAPSQINFSGANDFTNWTLGGEPTSPYNETINSPGSRITHITAACNGLMWFKETSFGIILNPDDALAAQNVILAPEIGTLDNTSVIYPGGIQFRAQDGHIYNYDCAGIEKLTRDITPTINTSGSRTSNSWTQTSQSDFNNGSAYTTFTDTAASSGDVVLFGVSEVWSSSSAWTTESGSFTVVSSSIQSTANTTSKIRYSTTKNIPRQLYLTYPFQFGAAGVGNDTTIAGGVRNTSGAGGYGVGASCSGTGWINILTGSDLTGTTQVASWTCDTSTHTLSLTISATGYAQAFLDGTYKGTITNTVQGTVFDTAVIRVFSQNTQTAKIGSFYVKAATGTYYSNVKNAPNITSFDSFTANYQNNDGTHSFFVRSSTNSFAIASSTPTWIAQTPGAVVSASTGTYFQVRDDFSITAATQNPTLNDFTFNWFEGVAADKSYGIYFGKDNALWWSVPVGAGQSTNNRILRYDLVNRGWVLYDIPANGFLIRNQNLYVGSADAGKIWKFGDTDSDEGAAINSYWKSKDFSFDPTVEKEFTTLSVVGKSVASSSMTVTYTVDGSSSTSYTIPLYNANSTIMRNNRYLPAGRSGNTLNVQFGNNAADQYWELFGGVFGYKKRPWITGN